MSAHRPPSSLSLSSSTPARFRRFHLPKNCAPAILIDERKGRRVAKDNGLETFGTLTVLERASERELLDFQLAIDALQRTTFRMSHQLIQDALARNAARKSTQ